MYSTCNLKLVIYILQNISLSYNHFPYRFVLNVNLIKNFPENTFCLQFQNNIKLFPIKAACLQKKC
jgi:hypothetical protein